MTHPIATSPIQSLARGAEPAQIISPGCTRSHAAGGRADVLCCLAVVRCVKDSTP